ncbi:hypothetical protein V6N12_070964 [Hibiscus sabdariffa]|uniref:CCHC-type domain-containing protein n=1 Tax=Hibiscus sabdariffa TaxID=183260 RepID=A0ABR2FIF1_9ROSI
MQEDEPSEDDDFEIQEGDVIRTVVDGLISIQFSKRVQSLAEKSFDRTIVLKLLGRRIGYSTLKNKINDLWKAKEGFKLMDIENDYFIVSFRSQEDYLTVLVDGPWTIFGHYLIVEPWSPEFSPLQRFPSRIVAWIRLPGLPATLYKRCLVEEIISCIGPIILSTIKLKVDVIEYESLPTICFSCGKYGHLTDNCTTKLDDPAETNDMAPPIPTQSSESDEAAFGPWMLVEKQQRRTGRMPQSVVPKHNERHAMGSRFNPIMEIQEDTLVRWEEDNSRRTNGVTESAIVYKQQGKFGTGAKQPRTLPVHKPLMIIDFPITSKATPKASISRTTPGKSGSVVLEKSRHSTVVISENSNPNCPSMDVDLDVNPTCPNSLVRGKPPDSCASLPAGTNMATLQTVQDVMIAKGAMPAAMQVNDMLDWPLVNSTPLWRAISNGWNEFLPNVAWSIGNRNAIDVFNDTWIRSLGPLRDHIDNPLLLSSGISLKDFVAGNGTWDCDALRDLFPASIIDCILVLSAQSSVILKISICGDGHPTMPLSSNQLTRG